VSVRTKIAVRARKAIVHKVIVRRIKTADHGHRATARKVTVRRIKTVARVHRVIARRVIVRHTKTAARVRKASDRRIKIVIRIVALLALKVIDQTRIVDLAHRAIVHKVARVHPFANGPKVYRRTIDNR